MSERPAESFAVLRIMSTSLSEGQISELVGLASDDKRRPGLPAPSWGNIWGIHSTLVETEPVEAHVADIIRRSLPVAEKVRTLSESNEVFLYCGTYCYSEEDFHPDMYLEPSVLRAMLSMNAALSYEAYFLGKD